MQAVSFWTLPATFVCNFYAKAFLTFLRWHYPNQVPGRALHIAHYLHNSQAPLSKSLPVSLQYEVISFSNHIQLTLQILICWRLLHFAAPAINYTENLAPVRSRLRRRRGLLRHRHCCCFHYCSTWLWAPRSCGCTDTGHCGEPG